MTYLGVTILGYLLALCFLLMLINIYIKLKAENRKLVQCIERSESDNRQLTLSLDSISDPIWIKDKKQKYVYCNPSFEQLIGLSKDNIIGYEDKEIQSLHPQLAQNFLPDRKSVV